MQRRKFSREFKLEAVKLVSDRGVAEAARDLDLHESVLRKWVREAEADPHSACPGNGQMKPEQREIERLRRELARMKAERDILKKGCGLLCEGLDMRFGFIAKHRGIWPVSWICEALDVSRSGGRGKARQSVLIAVRSHSASQRSSGFHSHVAILERLPVDPGVDQREARRVGFERGGAAVGEVALDLEPAAGRVGHAGGAGPRERAGVLFRQAVGGVGAALEYFKGRRKV